MTNKEFGILELLERNKGQVFSKEQIYDYVWGEAIGLCVFLFLSALVQRCGINGE